jgi:hypothetical protein
VSNAFCVGVCLAAIAVGAVAGTLRAVWLLAKLMDESDQEVSA